MIAGIVLAGGRATRMGGGDKPLLHLHGRPLLAHVIERLTPQVAALAISANGDPARFAAFGLPVLTAVNALNLPEFERFAEGLAVRLPTEPGAVLDWCRAVAAATI